ncbi:MAG: hypothetical protein IPO83_02135 [Chitinophagaceae bacterium]|nr:hypothetical protein [Chitinophagaceae bacterium]
MKKIIGISFLLIVIATTSCKKDDNTAPIKNNIQDGVWKITLYESNGNDETNHYTDYQFQFASNGTVTASKTGNTVSGTWSTTTDDSQEKLLLAFTVSPFDELSNDWHILNQSASLVELEDVSNGNGGTEHLTFQKL